MADQSSVSHPLGIISSLLPLLTSSTVNSSSEDSQPDFGPVVQIIDQLIPDNAPLKDTILQLIQNHVLNTPSNQNLDVKIENMKLKEEIERLNKSVAKYKQKSKKLNKQLIGFVNKSTIYSILKKDRVNHTRVLPTNSRN